MRKYAVQHAYGRSVRSAHARPRSKYGSVKAGQRSGEGLESLLKAQTLLQPPAGSTCRRFSVTTLSVPRSGSPSLAERKLMAGSILVLYLLCVVFLLFCVLLSPGSAGWAPPAVGFIRVQPEWRPPSRASLPSVALESVPVEQSVTHWQPAVEAPQWAAALTGPQAASDSEVGKLPALSPLEL